MDSSQARLEQFLLVAIVLARFESTEFNLYWLLDAVVGRRMIIADVKDLKVVFAIFSISLSG